MLNADWLRVIRPTGVCLAEAVTARGHLTVPTREGGLRPKSAGSIEVL